MVMAPPQRSSSHQNNPGAAPSTPVHDPLLEGFLDDLISLPDSPRSSGGGGGGGGRGGHGGGHGGPSASFDSQSQASSSAASASGTGFAGGGGASPAHWRLTNPVHMELQENARLPTFHWNVDRTGSAMFPTRRDSMTLSASGSASAAAAGGSGGGSSAPYTSNNRYRQQPSSSMDTDVNLAELFLSSSHRQGYHANYQQAGALRKDLAAAVNNRPRADNSRAYAKDRDNTSAAASESNTTNGGGEGSTAYQDPLDLLAAEVEPTPLAEIRRKHCERHRHQAYGYYPPYSSGRAGAHQHYALPIPTSSAHPPSPVQSGSGGRPSTAPPLTARNSGGGGASTASAPGAGVMPSPLAHALATAAAIASQTTTQQQQPQRQPSPPLTLPPPGPYTADQQQQQQQQPNITKPPPHQPRPNSAGARLGTGGLPTSNTTTKTTTTGALQRASQQKTQYGFGPKHVVPAVPAPPTKRGGRRSAGNSPLPTTISVSAAGGTGGGSARTSPNTTGAANSGDGGVVNQGEAYERKKQRAKSARIKLNESIERMSIAIHLGGTQSKQRRAQWQSLPASSDPNNNRQSSMLLLQECTQIAEGAKKWDRPSFVGAAASLLQGLNAQCEHLMQELMACHENLQQQKQTTNGQSNNADQTNNGAKRPADESNNLVSLDHDDGEGDGPSPKRLKGDEGLNGHSNSMIDMTLETGDNRVDDDHNDTTDPSVFGDKSIVTRVSRFLDPPTVVRCFLVSKSWKRVFAKQESWQEMAMGRFGQFNVRQWKGKLEDEDEGIACLPVTLYRSMDAANVMPHISHEGMFLLGEARLPGKVSAWTFLVERSNGETLRSAKRKENMPGTGIFASLPVVELRTVIQNTGSVDEPVVIREQLQTVDASTRRRGVEMTEIDWDDRFKKRVLNLDGSERPPESSSNVTGSTLDVHGILCRLNLFEAVVIETYIYAKGCSTTSKFVQRSNFTKVLVQIRSGTTVPLVVPFPRDISHHLEH